MTSLDARDVLNLPQDGSSQRPAKKPRTGGHASAGANRNLKGLAREVQSLGGESPISIVPQLSNIKKRRLANRKPAARWEMRPFTNSARDDKTLILRHWRRKAPGAAGGDAAAAAQPADVQGDNMETDDDQKQQTQQQPPVEDSAFAKFNVRVVVPQYSDHQYNANLQHPDWTKEETDYLMELVKDFDLRWPIIWDRYDYRPVDETSSPPAADSTAMVPARQAPDGSSRTMEDLKVRYYEIAAKMMAVQKPAQYMTQSEYNLHGIMANFNPDKERQRKAFVTNALMRSREEVREEEALLFEVRRIMDRTERTNEERRELYHRLEFPHADQDISNFKTSAGLQTLLQSLMYNNEKSKKRKSLAAGEGANAAGPSGAAAGAAGADAGSRRDSIAASASSSANRRETAGVKEDKAAAAESAASAAAASSAASAAATTTAPATPVSATPTAVGKNNKKGAPQMERRKLTEQEMDVYGVTYHERLGSGPTFRYEKINKLFTHKSGQQQLRITNILNELEMPARLFMPTALVTAQFEHLVTSVVQLVDLRKVSDKLDGEIKIEEQKKAERDRAKGIVSQTDSAGDADKKAAGASDKADTKADTKSDKDKKAEDAEAKAGDEAAGDATKDEKDGDDKKADDADTAAEVKPAEGEGKDKEEETDKKTVSTRSREELIPTKEGDGGGEVHEIRTRSGSRPGSSSNNAASGAAHKRSASVLSVASDKSSKRQKK
ncbi:swr complex subunit [Sporothrix eucalyptigena]|uniref:SWR1-complex protein 4 n=1 Tax=Sporothrix eucalyptigena TaxID=1812306 RepID=A0ABP0ARX3_9PEZI